MDEVVTAVLDFVNAGGAEMRRQLRSRAAVLLTDEADEILLRLIEQNSEDARDLDHLRARRALLYEAREYGVDRALAPPAPPDPAISKIVLQYVNLSDGSDLRAFLAEHLETLAGTEAARTFRELRLTYLDDENIQKHLRRRVAAAEAAQRHGVDRALEDTTFIITPELNQAFTALLQATDETVAEVLQQYSAVLLSDEALRMIDFVESGAEPDQDQVSHLLGLRSLLRAARSYGIEAAVEAYAGDGAHVPIDPTREALDRVAQAYAAGDWRKVIEEAPGALRKINVDHFPPLWGIIHMMAGTALSREPSGDRAAALEASIAHHEQARRVLSPTADVDAWSTNEHHLALAWLQRARGLRADNLDTAIGILRNLIATADREPSSEWLVTLADALRMRQHGKREADLEESVVLLNTVITGESPALARTQAMRQLGLVHLERSDATRPGEIDQAIELISRNLATLDPADDLTGWTHTTRTLAVAYLRRRQHSDDRMADWRTALDLLADITEACPRDGAPMLWAENQLAIAELHRQHPEGTSPERLRLQATLTESALDVYTREDHPDLWAKVQTNLGIVRGELSEFEAAQRHLDAALEVSPRVSAPHRWAMIHDFAGRLQLMRARKAEKDDRRPLEDAAISHFTRALEARTADTDPSGRLELLRLVAGIRFGQERWHEALATYVDAMRVADRMLNLTFTETGWQQSFSGQDLINGPAAYCLYRLNDPAAAIVCAEWGRSRMLARSLAIRDLDLANLPEPQMRSVVVARQRVRDLDAEMHANPQTAVGSQMRDAQEALDTALAGAGLAEPRLRMTEIAECVPTPGAVVLPILTSQGGVAVTLARQPDGFLQIWQRPLEPQTEFFVRAMLVGTDRDPGWTTRYRRWREGAVPGEKWREALREDLSWFWHFLVQPIAATLEERVSPDASVIIVPSGALSFLPWHAAAPGGDGVGGLLDHFPVSYAPSLYALRASRRRLATLDGSVDLLAIADPTGDLRFARTEVHLVAGLANRRTVLAGAEAGLASVTTAISGRSHLHFACHGVYDPDDPVDSGLRLADGKLTVAGLLDPAVDLHRVRLAVLSACETGLVDTRYAPDEFIGLSSAFLQAGACGVISTLWPVDDRATSLLTARFYQHHLIGGMPPGEALRAAQLWLREATSADLGGTESLDDRPFADPYYWAAFQLTGA